MFVKRITTVMGILGIIYLRLLSPAPVSAETMCTSYNATAGILHIPSLEIGERYFSANLKYHGSVFTLIVVGDATATPLSASWDRGSGTIFIPAVDFGNGITYQVRLHSKRGDGYRIAKVAENRSPLALNEIVAKDEEGGDDWVEVYVTGNSPVNLGNYTLIDDDPDHTPAALPAITLQPGEFYVIQATDEAPEDGSPYVPFKLGGDDAVALYRGSALVDVLDWEDGDAPEGYSFGRFPDGTGTAMPLSPTPGVSNEAAATDGVTRPDGWTDATHGDSADPDYDTVFPENEVKRIDLVFSSEDWQAMLDDMTELYGEFGGSGGTVPGDTGENETPPGPQPGGPLPDGTQPDGTLPDGTLPDGTLPADGTPLDGSQPDGIPPEDMETGTASVEGSSDTNPVWKPCTFSFEGKNWYYTGVRFKGNSSLMSTWRAGIHKLPFRLDFDQFEDDYPEIDDQRFYGFKKLSLASNYHDDSLIREKVMPEIFRAAGVPAPETAFYRLYVDYGEGPVYFGLYTMVEIPEGPMLDQQFLKDGGNLYKPDGTGATFAVYDEASLSKETNEDEADYGDVKALFDALHAGREDAETWRSGLEDTFDVDGFLKWLAVNTLVENWDTYGIMTHNYYLYNDPGDGLLHWVPWDNNESLGNNTRPPLSLDLSFQEVNDAWPLIRYLMDDAVYRAKYVEYVAETAESVFNAEKMAPAFAAAHSLIRPYVVGAEGELPGYTHLGGAGAFDTALDGLNAHVQTRYEAAMAFKESE